MNKYTILAVTKESVPGLDQTRYAVAYRDHKTGSEQYFVVLYSNQLLYESNSPIGLLLKTAAAQGGTELGMALEHYIKWVGAGWDKKTFSVSTEYEPVYSDSGHILKAYPTSMKIVVDEPVYDQGGYIPGYNEHKKHIHINPGQLYVAPLGEPVLSTHWKNIGYTDQMHFEYEPPSINSYTEPKGSSPSSLSNMLPGVKEKVIHPPHKVDDKHPTCFWRESKSMNSIKETIIHLNDIHKWTREEIADWLDSLDVDLRFQAPEDTLDTTNKEENNEQD